MRGLADAPETIRIVVTISLLVALLGRRPVDLEPEEAHPPPLLFPGQRLERLRRRTSAGTRPVAFGVADRRGRRPAAAAVPHPDRSRHAGVASTAVRSPCCTAPGRDRSAALAWAIGCSLAALAGILIAPLSGQLSHTNLTLLIVNAYAAAMFGRLRSLPMTFVGAVILGLADSYAIGYLPERQRSTSSTFRFVIPVVVLFVVLLVLPQPAAAHAHSARDLAGGHPAAVLARRALITAGAVVGGGAWCWPAS